MKNQVKYLVLTIQLFFVMVLFSSCSLSEDDLSSNDLNCASIATEYAILLEDYNESFKEFNARLGYNNTPDNLLLLEKDSTGNYSYYATWEKWRKDDPLQRENKFIEFVIKNETFCSWVHYQSKMLKYLK